MDRRLTRRTFVTQAASAACACAACPLLAAAAHGDVRSPAQEVDIGPLTDFTQDAVVGRWARSHGFFLVIRGGRVSAVSSTCTHRKVRLVAGKGGDAAFKCPRHGSTFDTAGRVTKSPARKSLPRFGIRVNDAGRVLVDRSSVRGSFIKLPPSLPAPSSLGAESGDESRLP